MIVFLILQHILVILVCYQISINYCLSNLDSINNIGNSNKLIVVSISILEQVLNINIYKKYIVLENLNIYQKS